MLIGIDGNEANLKNRVGSNQYAFQILTGLYELRKKQQTQAFFKIYLKKAPLPDLPSQRSWWQYRVFGPQHLWTRFRLPLELGFKTPRPDVFFSPGHYSPPNLPIPLVISVMDLGYLRYPDQFTKKDLYTLKNWTAASIKKARHVLAISEFTRQDILKTYRLPAAKVTTTLLGPDWPLYSPAKLKKDFPTVQKKYHLPGKYLLFLGTLKPSKNVLGLIEAFAKIAPRQPGLHLVIAGKKGWLYEDIYKQVETQKLTQKVIFTDFVSPKNLPSLMFGAQSFILPSFWEGFGIPILNAFSVGTPVVASRVASLPEVIGSAGILIDPQKPAEIAKGIQKVLVNRAKLRQAGFQQLKKFSWEKCASQTLSVLEKVATKS